MTVVENVCLHVSVIYVFIYLYERECVCVCVCVCVRAREANLPGMLMYSKHYWRTAYYQRTDLSITFPVFLAVFSCSTCVQLYRSAEILESEGGGVAGSRPASLGLCVDSFCRLSGKGWECKICPELTGLETFSYSLRRITSSSNHLRFHFFKVTVLKDLAQCVQKRRATIRRHDSLEMFDLDGDHEE